MNVYDPMIQRTVVMEDTPPEDGHFLAFLPSEFSYNTASTDQSDSWASTRSFMQEQWNIIAKNMNAIANTVCEIA